MTGLLTRKKAPRNAKVAKHINKMFESMQEKRKGFGSHKKPEPNPSSISSMKIILRLKGQKVTRRDIRESLKNSSDRS